MTYKPRISSTSIACHAEKQGFAPSTTRTRGIIHDFLNYTSVANKLKTGSADKLRWRVLVFPAGTENALEIWRALRHCKEVQLTGASSRGSHHGSYVYDDHAIIPRIDEAGCLDELNRAIRSRGIDFILPANDLVIDFLSGQRELLACPVLLPPHETVRLARSKSASLNALRGLLPIPRHFSGIDEVDAFPVFVKPDAMYGGQGALIVHTRAELEQQLARDASLLIQEYLPGQETTVDCFTDRHGRLLFSGARLRARVRMGTSMNAFLLGDDEQLLMHRHAELISTRLGMRGPWFFQMKRDAAGQWRFLETGVRIAGTMALNRVRGVNFPLLAIWDASGADVSIDVQNYHVEIDRCLHNRYRHDISYKTVYVDFDDTLVVHDRLNLEIVRFLFQCVNEGKRIVLISKSLATDKQEMLRRWRIEGLFDEKHWLGEKERKADYILDPNSIYIDDSFSQRHDVALSRNIPTFDASMVELLLDDRSS